MRGSFSDNLVAVIDFSQKVPIFFAIEVKLNKCEPEKITQCTRILINRARALRHLNLMVVE